MNNLWTKFRNLTVWKQVLIVIAILAVGLASNSSPATTATPDSSASPPISASPETSASPTISDAPSIVPSESPAGFTKLPTTDCGHVFKYAKDVKDKILGAGDTYTQDEVAKSLNDASVSWSAWAETANTPEAQAWLSYISLRAKQLRVRVIANDFGDETLSIENDLLTNMLEYPTYCN